MGEAVRAAKDAVSLDEKVCYLYDVALDPAWHSSDLADTANSVVLQGRMHDEIDGAGNGGHDEAAAHVLPREQRERAHLRHRLPGGVGVDRAHARQTAVQGDEEIQALGLAHLPDDDARGPHPQCLLHQASQGNLAGAFEARLPALHRCDVAQGDLQQDY